MVIQNPRAPVYGLQTVEERVRERARDTRLSSALALSCVPLHPPSHAPLLLGRRSYLGGVPCVIRVVPLETKALIASAHASGTSHGRTLRDAGRVRSSQLVTW